MVNLDTTVSKMDSTPTASDLIAQRIREVREGRGLTVAELAVRCKAAGMPKLTVQVLYKLEGQRANPDRRPRPVTVDELLGLAYVLDVSPLYLICGLGDTAEVPITQGLSVTTLEARNWIQGFGALPGTDEEAYAMSLPLSMRGGYARNVDEALAAVDGMRSQLLARKELQEGMRGLREMLMGEDPAS